MPVSLEHVLDHMGELDARAIQRNIEALASHTAGFGGKGVEIRFGRSSITFTASATSATTTVTHGLGRSPVVITFGVVDGSLKAYSGTRTTTTFDLLGKYDSVVTGTAIVDWIAIG